MELTKKMEKIMNDLIGERMEEVYQDKDGEQYDPFNAKMEMKMQKLIRKLSPKQGKVIFDYTTDLSNKCSDLNEFYYRMGLRDGLMLKAMCIRDRQVIDIFVEKAEFREIHWIESQETHGCSRGYTKAIYICANIGCKVLVEWNHVKSDLGIRIHFSAHAWAEYQYAFWNKNVEMDFLTFLKRIQCEEYLSLIHI